MLEDFSVRYFPLGLLPRYSVAYWMKESSETDNRKIFGAV
jgi:hypothetical protein